MFITVVTRALLEKWILRGLMYQASLKKKKGGGGGGGGREGNLTEFLPKEFVFSNKAQDKDCRC